MKVIFGGETKRIPEIKKFEELIKYSANIFNATQLQAAGNDLKLFYQDDEGDIISVTCQSDLEEAYRVLTGRIKLVFAVDEDKARQYLNGKGGQALVAQNDQDSFYRSEQFRPSFGHQSMLDRSNISNIHSDLGPNPMNNSRNMMGFMFEAFLQNQIEAAIRQRTMSGTSMLDMVGQPNLGALPVEGETLENPNQIEAIVENTDEKSNDVSDQNIEVIVKELDEGQESSSPAPVQCSKCGSDCCENGECSGTTECCCSGSAPCSCGCKADQDESNPYVETIDTVETKETPSKKNCKCEKGDLCFKCVLGKVFSLEPFFDTAEPTYEATCLDQPEEFVGVAGADFSATCTFKNSGLIAWPVNVQLKLVNGTIVVYNALGLENQCVQPNEELNVTIELKLPTTPGRYILSFRLVHGDDHEFGDEVTVNLLAQANTEEVSSTPRSMTSRLLNALEQPLNETSGDTFYVDQEQMDEDYEDSVNELDLSVNSWIMVRDDEEAAAEPPGTEQSEEKMGEEATPGCTKPDATPAPAEEEVQRNFCNQQVYMTRYDEMNTETLLARMKRGLEFEHNLMALWRHGNNDPAHSDVLETIE